jgi:DNA-binding beta-propeller fold protein YncE
MFAGTFLWLGLVASPASASARADSLIAPTAYVTNSQRSTVSVIQGTTLIATIGHIGRGPTGIAITPNNLTAYVVDYGFLGHPSHTVTPIDLTHRTVGQPIVVGTGPLAIAITPDGTKAVVTLQGVAARPGHQIVIIDLASATLTARVNVGTNPESLAIAPDGNTAYVANFSSASVTPINLMSSPPAAEAPIALPGTSPRAIAIAPDGQTAYVLDAEAATIIPIALANRTVGVPVDLVCTKQGDPGCTPTAIAVRRDGRGAYVAAAGSGDVIELALPSLSVTRVIPTGGYPDALGIASNWLFVANGASNSVSVSHHGAAPVDVPGLSYPFGVAVAPGTG